MIIVKHEQLKELKSYIDNIEELIAADDIQNLLDAIDDVIVSNILENNDEPDDEGIRLQRIYDQIYMQNS